MSWLYGQTWLWYLIAFVVGVLLAWLLFVLPQQRRLRALQARTAAPAGTGTGTTTAAAPAVAAAAGLGGAAVATAVAAGGHDHADDATVTLSKADLGAVEPENASEVTTAMALPVDEARTEQFPAVDSALSTLDARGAAGAQVTGGPVGSGLLDAGEPTTEIPMITPATTAVDAGASDTDAADAPVEAGTAAGAGLVGAGALGLAAVAGGRHSLDADESSADESSADESSADESSADEAGDTPDTTAATGTDAAEAAASTTGTGVLGTSALAATTPATGAAATDSADIATPATDTAGEHSTDTAAGPAGTDAAGPPDPAGRPDPAGTPDTAAVPAAGAAALGLAGLAAVGGNGSTDRSTDGPEDATAATDGPYGPGSALPLADGSAPGAEYTVKGNAGSMLFHTTESPYYVRTRAEAWFRTAADAETAGFTAWNKRRTAPAQGTAAEGIAAAPAFTPGPHPGSALPAADGSAPTAEFTVKGNADSMLFHSTESPYYVRTKAEAWFRTAADAEAAGFTAWNKRAKAAGETSALAVASASAAAPAFEAGPYPLSARPGADGTAPTADFTIKGNAGSMLYHGPTSPYYARTKAEAWFRTGADAEAAGFTAWRRK
ncbi:hypothetical protein [Pseudonocardia sp. GCM10023141]|uniref:sunset domain-containing protein n=1 Tax=Pseudonocardia sp. GCM10023141 TaxID=3252653 RepID=UPI0036090072